MIGQLEDREPVSSVVCKQNLQTLCESENLISQFFSSTHKNKTKKKTKQASFSHHLLLPTANFHSNSVRAHKTKTREETTPRHKKLKRKKVSCNNHHKNHDTSTVKFTTEKMVSTDNRTGLYVTVPVYFLFLAAAAFWAYRRNKSMDHKGTSDKLTAHYLAGRDFGPLMTAGTVFASLFSGYTVVGVPNEAFNQGWMALRWIPTLMAVVTGYFGTGLRLRKASNIRNHQSPVDFITDRYQSQVLRYTILSLQILPTIIYLAAQVIAIKKTFNSIFELDPDNSYPVILIMVLILLFEWAGGLNSVALTDTIQAVIMVTSFILIPFVIIKNWGGWRDLDPETYPKPEFYQTPSKESQWDFWQFSLINFGFFTLPHLMQRTYAARDIRSLKAGYSAMTIGVWFTSFVGVFMGTVGVSMLLTKEDENGNPVEAPANPASAILEELISIGGIGQVSGVIAITASLAAIMSTADSLIIAISQLITTEIVYPLRPKATPSEMAIVGKIVSLCSVVLALLVGLFWGEGITDLGKIQFALSAQAAPAFLIGLFSYNRTTDAHPWCIAAGAWTAALFVVVFYFGYTDRNGDSAKPIGSGEVAFVLQLVVIYSLEAMRRLVGVGGASSKSLNKAAITTSTTASAVSKDEEAESGTDRDVPKVKVSSDDTGTSSDNKRDDSTNVVSVEDGKTNDKNPSSDVPLLLYSERPTWDVPKLSRFGDGTAPLTPAMLWRAMEGVNEPLANPWWCFLMFFSISMCTPIVAGMEPPLMTSATGQSFFANAPAVVNGLPWWVFKITLFCVIPTVLLLVAIMSTPNQFPESEEEKIVASGDDDKKNINNNMAMINDRWDANLVEMTRDEMGRRTSYDETNEWIQRRRSSISQYLEKEKSYVSRRTLNDTETSMK